MDAITIIIPVLHESDLIPRCLEQCNHLQTNSSFEIIVVDGSPTNDTINTLTDKAVTKVSSPTGRAKQMNTGAQHASGDILLFLHADTTLPPQALTYITDVMQDPRLAGGAFSLAIDTPDPRLHLIAHLTTLRSRLTRIPFGDQTIFIRKNVFDQLGGYRDIPLMEDVDLMRRLRHAHHHITILPSKARTSPRRWEHDGIFISTLRNWTLRTLYYLGVPPTILHTWYHTQQRTNL